MRNAGWQPSAKLYVEGYELDFALLEQGLRLNVEVDGDHHVDARGRLRRQDLARDRILMGIGDQVVGVPGGRGLVAFTEHSARQTGIDDVQPRALPKGPSLTYAGTC
jgi:hypothetical protein